MKNKKIIIAGGTGFIGQSLLRYFGKDNEVVILGRDVTRHENNAYRSGLLTARDGYQVRYCCWDAQTLDGDWTRELEACDLVINLAGKSVNCRYHHRAKQKILMSRVRSTQVIGSAIRQTSRPPALWINASSATIYRDTYGKANDEADGIISDRRTDNMPFNVIDRTRFFLKKGWARVFSGQHSPAFGSLDQDFSVVVCREWERAFFEADTPGTRKVALRTAITLDAGGVIIPFLQLCKFALGGRQGNGKQFFSWVHAEDIARMIAWLFDHPESCGIYNCAAPTPVTNEQWMRSLRQMTGHRFGIPAPALLLEMGAFAMGTETELLLKSRKVVSSRAMAEGFAFRYPTIQQALPPILAQLPRRSYHLF